MSYDRPGQPAPYDPPPQHSSQQQPPTAFYPAYDPWFYPLPPRPLNGYALASLIISITSLMSCLIVFSPVGAIMGHVARKQIAARNEQGAGMAMAGIIIGWVGTAAMVPVIAAFVLPFWV